MSPESEALIVDINKMQLRLFEYYLQKSKQMSNKPTVYILQKDTPIYKKGQRFERTAGYIVDLYMPINYTPDLKNKYPGTQAYERHAVENNTEWFLPEEDNELRLAKKLLASKGYVVFSKDQESLSEKLRELYGVAGLKYTEEDMLRCFNHAMDYVMRAVDKPHLQPVTSREFFNYLNSLNKQTNGAR
jgi:hypothetical protein